MNMQACHPENKVHQQSAAFRVDLLDPYDVQTANEIRGGANSAKDVALQFPELVIREKGGKRRAEARGWMALASHKIVPVSYLSWLPGISVYRFEKFAIRPNFKMATLFPLTIEQYIPEE